MRLRVREMELKDVETCASLVMAHPEERRRYGPFLAHLPSAWMRLLPTGCLNTTVVESAERNTFETVAVGVSGFIDDQLLSELKSARAWIGPTLTKRVEGRTNALLTAPQIREANSTSGLNLAIWTGVISLSHADATIDVELFRAFFDRHAGYRIKEIICQPVDLQQIVATFKAGLFWLSDAGEYVDGQFFQAETMPTEPFFVGADREAAKRAFGSWLSGLLLSHHEVRMYLRPGEQRLLLAAMRGLTDEELVDELGISLSAVKKTWRMIYDRTGSIWNEDGREKKAGEADGKRGKEKKQHLLTYLRGHMEELRPVLPP